MFRLFLTLILTIAVASAAGAAEPKAAKTDADNVSTAREFVSRLVAHGVTAEAIEKSFGKPVAELSDEDAPGYNAGWTACVPRLLRTLLVLTQSLLRSGNRSRRMLNCGKPASGRSSIRSTRL